MPEQGCLRSPVRPVEVMPQCLTLLLFEECNDLLNPFEIECWAATETVLWNLYQQEVEANELYLRYCEMVDEGWFSDRLQGAPKLRDDYLSQCVE